MISWNSPVAASYFHWFMVAGNVFISCCFYMDFKDITKNQNCIFQLYLFMN